MSAGFWTFMCVLAICVTIISCLALTIFYQADEGDPPKRPRPSQNMEPL